MKAIIENFGLDSLNKKNITSEINHCIDNSKKKDLSEEEAAYRKKYLYKNFILAGTCESVEEIKKEISEAEKIIKTNRNKFPLKEIVTSINLPDELRDNEQILIDWAKEVMLFWNNIGASCCLGFVHLNEIGKPHIHLFLENWNLEKKKWGWKLGKLKPHELKKIHKQFDIVLENFAAKWNLEHIDKATYKEIQIKSGKHMNIWEFKNLFNNELEDENNQIRNTEEENRNNRRRSGEI